MYLSTVPMAKSKQINLLPQEEFEASTLGRILHWAMGSFRIIVIVTEMIVMGAFLSRFWLDAKNSDLSGAIKVASSQIQVQEEFEQRFRSLQTKLDTFTQITKSAKASNNAAAISEKVPQGIIITSLVVRESTSEIIGNADSETNIAQLISNLKADSTIKKVELGDLSTSETGQTLISFKIIISY